METNYSINKENFLEEEISDNSDISIEDDETDTSEKEEILF